MRNITDKISKDNQNAHFRFRNFFPKIMPFVRSCGKTWWWPAGDDSMRVHAE